MAAIATRRKPVAALNDAPAHANGLLLGGSHTTPRRTLAGLLLLARCDTARFTLEAVANRRMRK